MNLLQLGFDYTITIGNLITVIGGVFACGIFYGKMSAIEKKLDEFITKAEVSAMKEGADKEHASIRREINGITKRLEGTL